MDCPLITYLCGESSIWVPVRDFELTHNFVHERQMANDMAILNDVDSYNQNGRNCYPYLVRAFNRTAMLDDCNLRQTEHAVQA